MKTVLNRNLMRLNEQATILSGVDDVELVRRVAEAAYKAVAWKAPVAIVCGKGNNGADGLALARVLHAHGVQCTAFSVVMGPMSNARRHYHELCREDGVDLRVYEPGEGFAGYATVVDCVMGIGFAGEPHGPAATAIRDINASDAYVVSMDINSGLDADNGLATLAVKSHLTLAVDGFKAGHFLNQAADYIGALDNLEVGILSVAKGYRLVEPTDLKDLLPERAHNSHKGDYGYVALLGGSLPYSGAIRLGAMAAAAMRAGAGVVKVAAPESLCSQLVPHVLESTLYRMPDKDGDLQLDEYYLDDLTHNVRSLAFGMGAGEDGEIEEILRHLLAHYKKRLVVDADGLNAMAELKRNVIANHVGELVLTPHLKEFSRLTEKSVADVAANGIQYAEEYASETHSVVLLKGPTTIITDGTDTYLVQAGAPGMATAGSGDVLSGILAATLAWVPELLPAVYLAAYVNGRAGELAQAEMGDISMIASDTVAKIPDVIRELRLFGE